MVNAISTLVGEELEGRENYYGTVAGTNNGSVYCIPFRARQVAKFNPVDKSMTHIGPDLGDGFKWGRGAMTGNGIIYCVPKHENRGILKIDTNTDTATELEANLLPERGPAMWSSCVAALDGCIYFMPDKARRIMKLDPNNNDAISSVGDDLGDKKWKYNGTVVGIDGCLYGLPDWSKRILKYDPINDVTSFVGDKCDEYVHCKGDGTLGRDGCIYAIAEYGRVLKIETTNNIHCFVGDSGVEPRHLFFPGGWGDAILGIDGCIYSPPMDARRILKYDPNINQRSLVGDDLVKLQGSKWNKWRNGTLASNGVIYCLPTCANQVLSIDPWKEFSINVTNNMNEHSEAQRFLFQISDSDPAPNQTFFDCAVTKFGMDRVFEFLAEYMPPADKMCSISNLYPFMIAASYETSALSIIYYLLRQHPSLPDNLCTNEKKRKRILVFGGQSN